MGDHSAPEEVCLSVENKSDLINSFTKSDKCVTEEEFQNFMHRVNEVEKIVKQLASTNVEDQKRGMFLADEILETRAPTELSDAEELKVKTDRTIINKYSAEDLDPSKMSQESFKSSVERDAKNRAELRRARNERADTYKRIGNGAYREADYEKAVTYFTKALEQRRDSSVLWNNRALAYMALGLYERALDDCGWALKINEANIKALLNSAKCHKLLGREDECSRLLSRARETNPRFLKYITEFEENLESGRASESMGGAAGSFVD